VRTQQLDTATTQNYVWGYLSCCDASEPPNGAGNLVTSDRPAMVAAQSA